MKTANLVFSNLSLSDIEKMQYFLDLLFSFSILDDSNNLKEITILNESFGKVKLSLA